MLKTEAKSTKRRLLLGASFAFWRSALSFLHMMNLVFSFIGEAGWTFRAVAKLTAIVLGALIALSIVIAIVGVIFRFAFYGAMPGRIAMPSSVSSVAYDSYGGYGAGMAEMSYDGLSAADSKMAAQTYLPTPPIVSVNGSRNAEKFERTGYNASFETSRLDKTCDAVEGLKPLDYVLFDSANRSEDNCWYQFRVETTHAEEVLTTIKALEPSNLSSDVQTVAQNIEDATDRIAALKRQRVAVDTTLAEAERAYDDAIRSARLGQTGGLASLVTDKLSMIERLTNTRISLDDQIRALEGGKDDVLDDTTYTHFSVSVSRVSLVDWDGLATSWRYAFQNAVREASEILSSIVLTIPVLALRLVWFMVLALASIAALAVFARLAYAIVLFVWRWRSA